MSTGRVDNPTPAWLALPFKLNFYALGTKRAHFGLRAPLGKAAEGEDSQPEHRLLRRRPQGGTDGFRRGPLLGGRPLVFLRFPDSRHWAGPSDSLQSGSLS